MTNIEKLIEQHNVDRGYCLAVIKSFMSPHGASRDAIEEAIARLEKPLILTSEEQ